MQQMDLQPAHLRRFWRGERLDHQPEVGPGRFFPGGLWTKQQAQDLLAFGRQLQAAEVMASEAVEPHEGRRHAGAAQRLREGPELVGLVFGAHDEQICGFDSHPHRSRGIELLRSVQDNEASVFAAGFTGDHQGEALGSASLFGCQPFDKASAAKPAVGQKLIKLGATGGQNGRRPRAPAVLQVVNLAAESLDEGGGWRMGHKEAPQGGEIPDSLPLRGRGRLQGRFWSPAGKSVHMY